MISPTQAESIKKIIGIDYANKIVEFLKTKKIVSRNGGAYSAGYIREILNPKKRNQNTDIENGIWLMLEELEKKKKAQEELLKRLDEDV